MLRLFANFSGNRLFAAKKDQPLKKLEVSASFVEQVFIQLIGAHSRLSLGIGKCLDHNGLDKEPETTNYQHDFPTAGNSYQPDQVSAQSYQMFPDSDDAEY